MLKRLLVVAMAAAALPIPVLAGGAADVLRDGLYAGEIAATASKLEPLAEAGDQEARFGLGIITFVTAIEDLSQVMYRHGAVAPDGGPLAAGFLGLQTPGASGPANPEPTPLNYDLFRTEIESLVLTLDSAADTLQQAGESGDYVVRLDLTRIRLDLNDDGQAEESEAIGAVIAAAMGTSVDQFTARPAAPGTRGQAAPSSTPSVPEAPDATVGFDRADAIWLAGYSNVIAAQGDFLLAHDFSDFFNASFHRFFPGAGLPMADYSRSGLLALDPETDSAIADAIAAIHTINWPVVDAARLKRVHARLSAITALSRKNWDAILAETDDDRELVPSPRQTAIVPEGTVTDEMVSAWRDTLDTADRIIAGELLIPHWRFTQGFDLKAYFETAQRTDFVMILTGFGALPFLKDGPIATAESFAAANRVFGDNLLGYAFWFN